mmetsp:Transcript_17305/g.41947  ORF Transcript_17305/g.41947 Transcript_17305/m.41947 type:complete len:212 (+) Transcript_17305:1-636(+)
MLARRSLDARCFLSGCLGSRDPRSRSLAATLDARARARSMLAQACLTLAHALDLARRSTLWLGLDGKSTLDALARAHSILARRLLDTRRSPSGLLDACSRSRCRLTLDALARARSMLARRSLDARCFLSGCLGSRDPRSRSLAATLDARARARSMLAQACLTLAHALDLPRRSTLSLRLDGKSTFDALARACSMLARRSLDTLAQCSTLVK